MITPDLLRSTMPLFASCTDDDLAALALAAADIQLIQGQWLTQEGEPPAFYMLLEGALQITKYYAGVEQVLNHYKPGDYFGETPLLLGATVFANLRVTSDTARVARLDGPDFFQLVMHSEALSAQVLKTMAWRVNAVQQKSVETPQERMLLVGHAADFACYDLRQFLSGNRLAFTWLDPDAPGAAAMIPGAVRNGPLPSVVLSNGDVMLMPTRRALAERVGLQTAPASGSYDVAIIGGGPAGLAAAVYGASEGLSTLMLERSAPGGQAGTSSRIENYLGFPTGLSGSDLGTRALTQAKRFGTEVVVSRSVTRIDAAPGKSIITLDGGDSVCARSLVLATGVSWRSLDVPGADALVGRGIYYGAARTEAMGVRGKEVYLIGGGNSAGQAALFFADYAASVTLLIRAETIEKGMSQYLIDQLATKANVHVCLQSRVTDVHGQTHLEAIMVQTEGGGGGQLQARRFATESLFVFIGADAETSWLPDAISRDGRGYILTGRDAADCGKWPLERDPYLLETTVPGIFAAGDVRHDSIKRVASGVGEGSMSIAFIHQYLAGLSSAHVT